MHENKNDLSYILEGGPVKSQIDPDESKTVTEKSSIDSEPPS
jgi:hypothetical protein